MSLPHAILGFLDVMPLTGYDLKNLAFDRTVAHFWPAAQPQIYRELERMTDAGWVTRQIEMQEGRPNRHVYSITTSGRGELQCWLQSYQPPPAHREAFLIQLFFAAQLPKAAIHQLLEQQLMAHQQRLRQLEQIEAPQPTTLHEQQRRFFALMTRDLGQRLEQTYIAWLQSCIQQVDAWDDQV